MHGSLVFVLQDTIMKKYEAYKCMYLKIPLVLPHLLLTCMAFPYSYKLNLSFMDCNYRFLNKLKIWILINYLISAGNQVGSV